MLKRSIRLTPTESEIQKAIINWLRGNGIYCWRNNTTGIYDPARKTFRKNNGYGCLNGVSDILGIDRYGKMIAIEVKRHDGVLSLEQRHFLQQISKSKGHAIVAKSLDDVQAYFSTRVF